MRGLFATVSKVGRRANSNEHVIPKGEVQQESNDFKFAMLISWNLDPVLHISQCQRATSTGGTYMEFSGSLLFLVQRCTPPLCSPSAHPPNSFLLTHALIPQQLS